MTICGTDTLGTLLLEGGSRVTLGDPLTSCAPNRFVGTVRVTNTSGPSVMAGNVVIGQVACSGNAPPPVDTAPRTASSVARPVSAADSEVS